MQSYTKVYFEFFGYTVADWVPCTCCQLKQATEIHHIYPRSLWKGKLNDITNLCAICRSCHEKFSAKKYRGFLLNLQQELINERRKAKG